MVQSVDRKRGKCDVVTERGREVEVHIGTPMAGIGGTGVKVTPRINAKCMVVLFVSGNTGMVRPEDGYLISTFQAEQGNTEEWGAPGDFHLTTDGGGEMLMSQSGIINHEADPWARQAFLPKDKTIKQWAKNYERLHTPLSHNKTIHDSKAEVAFDEFALNSRFLHRENDSRPDIYRALGSAEGSEKASNFHPQAGALSFYRLEQRSEQGQPEERLTRLEGAAEREIQREQFEDLRDGNSLIRSIGINGATFQRTRLNHGDATRELKLGKGIETAGEVSREKIEYDGTSLLFRRGHFEETLTETRMKVDDEDVFTKQIFDDGRIKAENPTWTVEVDAENSMTLSNEDTTITVEDDTVTVDNGSTSFEVTGSNIYVGQSASSEKEPLVLGKALEMSAPVLMARGRVARGLRAKTRWDEFCPSWDRPL
jgi:hypothetical protein